MALKRVEERLSRLANIVEKWNKSGDVPYFVTTYRYIQRIKGTKKSKTYKICNEKSFRKRYHANENLGNLENLGDETPP